MVEPPHLQRNPTGATLPTECESTNSNSATTKESSSAQEYDPISPPIPHVVVPATYTQQQAAAWPPPSSSSSPEEKQWLFCCLARCYLVTTLCQLVGVMLLTRTSSWHALVLWMDDLVWIRQQQSFWILLCVVVLLFPLWDAIPTMLLLWRTSNGRQQRPNETSEEPFLLHTVLIDVTAADDDDEALRATFESLAASRSAADSCVVVLVVGSNDTHTAADGHGRSLMNEYLYAFRDVLCISHRHEALPALEQYLHEGSCSTVDPAHVLLTVLPAKGTRFAQHYWDTLVAKYRSLPDGRQFLFQTPIAGPGSCNSHVVALTLGLAQSLHLLHSNPWTAVGSYHRVSVHAHAVTGSPLVVTLPTAMMAVFPSSQAAARHPWTVAVEYEQERNYTSVVEVLQWYPDLPLGLWWRLLRRVVPTTPRRLLLLCLLRSSTVLCGAAALLLGYVFVYTWGKALLWEHWLRRGAVGRTPVSCAAPLQLLRTTILATCAAEWVMLRELSSSRREQDPANRRRPVKKAI